MDPQPQTYDQQTLHWLRRRLQAGDPLHFATSGSTGIPKTVELSAHAVRANARATNSALGYGTWLLALPLTHIAGWMVCTRALEAGTDVVHAGGPFSAAGFCDAGQTLAGSRWLTALVPTQLSRILEDRAATELAATAHRIIVGGAAVRPAMLERAAAYGIAVVRTYGMTETSGGCVYDGLPLPGVRVRIGDTEVRSGTNAAPGLISVAGPMLADGYRTDKGLDEAGFTVENDGTRWFSTTDIGEIHDGRVSVLGRADDVIISGGENVHPLMVEKALGDLPQVAAAVVVGIPDPEWGEVVCALVQPVAAVAPGDVRDAVRAAAKALPPAARPRRVVLADVPLKGIGKPDRRAAQRIVSADVS